MGECGPWNVCKEVHGYWPCHCDQWTVSISMDKITAMPIIRLALDAICYTDMYRV